MTDPPQPTPEDAARSLADVEARRRQVIEEELRAPRWLVPVNGLLIAAWHARKDLRGTQGYRVYRASIVLAAAVHAAALLRERRVSIHRTAMEYDEHATRAIAEMVGSSVGLIAAERVVGVLFRRTRLRYPNTAAGVVLGIAMPPLSLAVQRRLLTRLAERAGR